MVNLQYFGLLTFVKNEMQNRWAITTYNYQYQKENLHNDLIEKNSGEQGYTTPHINFFQLSYKDLPWHYPSCSIPVDGPMMPVTQDLPSIFLLIFLEVGFDTRKVALNQFTQSIDLPTYFLPFWISSNCWELHDLRCS